MDANEFTVLTKLQPRVSTRRSLKVNSVQIMSKENKENENYIKIRSHKSLQQRQNAAIKLKSREMERRAFEKLHEILPTVSKQKRSTRVEVLRETSNYIRVLQEMLVDLSGNAASELLNDCYSN